MFFLLAGVMDRFVHLKTGLALVLAFVGTKMLITDLVKIPITASLGVVAALIRHGVSALFATWTRRSPLMARPEIAHEPLLAHPHD
jgi:tellurite resistance protein TerC